MSEYTPPEITPHYDGPSFLSHESVNFGPFVVTFWHNSKDASKDYINVEVNKEREFNVFIHQNGTMSDTGGEYTWDQIYRAMDVLDAVKTINSVR